jgi:K+-transporting ATPase ATPase C chain
VVGQIRPAIVVFLFLTVVTGAIYPGIVSIVARLAFPREARGSLIERDGRIVGSSLIGQPFHSEKYFRGRDSATTPAYNGGASSGSNLGPLNPALIEAVEARVKAVKETSPAPAAGIPVDLVTTSGSGLDPHISPAAAEIQVPRVARVRGISEDRVRELVRKHTLPRTLGLLGEPRVNVLELNLALDEAQ